jgi:hypothetical protein
MTGKVRSGAMRVEASKWARTHFFCFMAVVTRYRETAL